MHRRVVSTRSLHSEWRHGIARAAAPPGSGPCLVLEVYHVVGVNRNMDRPQPWRDGGSTDKSTHSRSLDVASLHRI